MAIQVALTVAKSAFKASGIGMVGIVDGAIYKKLSFCGL
jgi:hypothetical protein